MLKPSDLHALTPLGIGPGTRVWKGLDENCQPLLLKTFSLAEAPNWKAEELFAREAQVLQQLDHPCLPQLLAYGVEDQHSYLIYPFIEGESLQAKLEAGWRPDQTEIFELIRQLLKTLIWLHDRQPPLVHRDIKPSNLILTADGHLFLIDFGSVLQHLKPQGGSTVAGTFGYMAPEQLSGRALPASDLYGVGASLIHLLSGKAPSELPQERLWIRFEAYVQLSPPLQRWLKTLIDPVLEERCENARQALAGLEKALIAQTYSAKAPAIASPQTEMGLMLGEKMDLVKRWPIPIPESGMVAIEVQKVPQGVSILLPRRESKQSLNELTYVNISTMAIGLGLLKINPWGLSVLELTPLIFQYFALLAGIFGVTYYRHHRRKERQTHLTLSDDKLIVHFSDKQKSLHIPWASITKSKLLYRGLGIQLKYRDPKTGRSKRLLFGSSLASYEQYWLFAVLTDYKDRLINPALAGKE
ncbi:MAG: serine/threonine protein kinase [Candidatus Sericytochromatia bacterium]